MWRCAAWRTRRAGRWATVQVGRCGRPVEQGADELGCDWHTANDAVVAWGAALLAADGERVGEVEAVGLDETLFARSGRRRRRLWCTSIVDVQRGQLLDTEAINNLTGRAKRAAHRFRRFTNYRIRALLYAGRPNRALLATITPR